MSLYNRRSIMAGLAGLCLVGSAWLALSTTAGAAATSQPAAPAQVNARACTVQPVTTSAGVIITPTMAANINRLEPLYKQAAISQGLSWLLLPPLHYRESNLQTVNPANGQGVFQLYSSGERFTPGEAVPPDEFVHQAALALSLLNAKAPPGGLTSDANLAWAYFGYNGRALAYYRQAQAKGLAYPFEGSPYVYNLYSPQATGLQLITSDNSNTLGPVDTRPGAFTLYQQLVQQCGSAVTAASTAGASFTSQQTATNPFAGEVMPMLPPTGKGSLPIYAMIGTILLAWVLLMAWKREVFTSTAVTVVWWTSLLVIPALFVHDQLALEAWHYNPDQSALTLALEALGLLFLVGGVVAIRDWYSWFQTGEAGPSRPRRLLNAVRCWNAFNKVDQWLAQKAEAADTDHRSGAWLCLTLLRAIWGVLTLAYKTAAWGLELLAFVLYVALWCLEFLYQHLSQALTALLAMVAVYAGYRLAVSIHFGLGVSFIAIPVTVAVVLTAMVAQQRKQPPATART